MRTSAVFPPATMELGTILDKAGERLAFAGGPVCDAFLGVIPHDSDMTTSARPERAEELLAQQSNVTWDIGKEFGTIGGRRDDLIVEMTTYRTDEYGIGLRKPEVTFSDTLEGGLTRHDSMVNAMAMRLLQMTLVDPCDGLADLTDDDPRTSVSAEQSFDDDPLRIMRVVRFSAQLGLNADMDVMNAMEIMASRLEIVSAERICAELERLIISSYPRCGIKLMVHTGVADIALSEVVGPVSTVDEHRRHKDVHEHTFTVVEQAMDLETGPDGAVPAPDSIPRFAAFMHDVGKPVARRFKPNGIVSFHHHKIVGVRMARKRMEALYFDEATIETVSNLVALHPRLHGYGEAAWSDSAVRRYVVDAGNLLERLHRLTHVDYTTHNRCKANYLSAAYSDLETRIAALREQKRLNATHPDLDGDQIMKILGLRPSRTVKIARDCLLGLRMERGLLGKEAARQALLGWWASDDVRAPVEEYQAQQAHRETEVAEKKACKVAAKAAREAQGQ